MGQRLGGPTPSGASLHEVDLWAAFAAPLRAFVRKRVPDAIEPDDVVQDVFLRIARNVHTIDAVERLDAWVFQIARSAVADAVRAHRRREARTDPVDADTLPELFDDAPAVVAELSPCVTPFVERLREPYRTALELTALHGLTQQEAAEREGVSFSGMKSRVQRARDQVRDLMLRCCEIQLDARGEMMDYHVRDTSICGTPDSASSAAPGCGTDGCAPGVRPND